MDYSQAVRFCSQAGIFHFLWHLGLILLVFFKHMNKYFYPKEKQKQSIFNLTG